MTQVNGPLPSIPSGNRRDLHSVDDPKKIDTSPEAVKLREDTHTALTRIAAIAREQLSETSHEMGLAEIPFSYSPERQNAKPLDTKTSLSDQIKPDTEHLLNFLYTASPSEMRTATPDQVKTTQQLLTHIVRLKGGLEIHVSGMKMMGKTIQLTLKSVDGAREKTIDLPLEVNEKLPTKIESPSKRVNTLWNGLSGIEQKNLSALLKSILFTHTQVPHAEIGSESATLHLPGRNPVKVQVSDSSLPPITFTSEKFTNSALMKDLGIFLSMAPIALVSSAAFKTGATIHATQAGLHASVSGKDYVLKKESFIPNEKSGITIRFWGMRLFILGKTNSGKARYRELPSPETVKVTGRELFFGTARRLTETLPLKSRKTLTHNIHWLQRFILGWAKQKHVGWMARWMVTQYSINQFKKNYQELIDGFRAIRSAKFPSPSESVHKSSADIESKAKTAFTDLRFDLSSLSEQIRILQSKFTGLIGESAKMLAETIHILNQIPELKASIETDPSLDTPEKRHEALMAAIKEKEDMCKSRIGETIELFTQRLYEKLETQFGRSHDLVTFQTQIRDAQTHITDLSRQLITVSTLVESHRIQLECRFITPSLSRTQAAAVRDFLKTLQTFSEEDTLAHTEQIRTIKEKADLLIEGLTKPKTKALKELLTSFSRSLAAPPSDYTFTKRLAFQKEMVDQMISCEAIVTEVHSHNPSIGKDSILSTLYAAVKQTLIDAEKANLDTVNPVSTRHLFHRTVSNIETAIQHLESEDRSPADITSLKTLKETVRDMETYYTTLVGMPSETVSMTETEPAELEAAHSQLMTRLTTLESLGQTHEKDVHDFKSKLHLAMISGRQDYFEKAVSFFNTHNSTLGLAESELKHLETSFKSRFSFDRTTNFEDLARHIFDGTGIRGVAILQIQQSSVSSTITMLINNSTDTGTKKLVLRPSRNTASATPGRLFTPDKTENLGGVNRLNPLLTPETYDHVFQKLTEAIHHTPSLLTLETESASQSETTISALDITDSTPTVASHTEQILLDLLRNRITTPLNKKDKTTIMAFQEQLTRVLRSGRADELDKLSTFIAAHTATLSKLNASITPAFADGLSTLFDARERQLVFQQMERELGHSATIFGISIHKDTGTISLTLNTADNKSQKTVSFPTRDRLFSTGVTRASIPGFNRFPSALQRDPDAYARFHARLTELARRNRSLLHTPESVHLDDFLITPLYEPLSTASIDSTESSAYSFEDLHPIFEALNTVSEAFRETSFEFDDISRASKLRERIGMAIMSGRKSAFDIVENYRQKHHRIWEKHPEFNHVITTLFSEMRRQFPDAYQREQERRFSEIESALGGKIKVYGYKALSNGSLALTISDVQNASILEPELILTPPQIAFASGTPEAPTRRVSGIYSTQSRYETAFNTISRWVGTSTIPAQEISEAIQLDFLNNEAISLIDRGRSLSIDSDDSAIDIPIEDDALEIRLSPSERYRDHLENKLQTSELRFISFDVRDTSRSLPQQLQEFTKRCHAVRDTLSFSESDIPEGLSRREAELIWEEAIKTPIENEVRESGTEIIERFSHSVPTIGLPTIKGQPWPSTLTLPLKDWISITALKMMGLPDSSIEVTRSEFGEVAITIDDSKIERLSLRKEQLIQTIMDQMAPLINSWTADIEFGDMKTAIEEKIRKEIASETYFLLGLGDTLKESLTATIRLAVGFATGTPDVLDTLNSRAEAVKAQRETALSEAKMLFDFTKEAYSERLRLQEEGPRTFGEFLTALRFESQYELNVYDTFLETIQNLRYGYMTSTQIEILDGLLEKQPKIIKKFFGEDTFWQAKKTVDAYQTIPVIPEHFRIPILTLDEIRGYARDPLAELELPYFEFDGEVIQDVPLKFTDFAMIEILRALQLDRGTIKEGLNGEIKMEPDIQFILDQFEFIFQDLDQAKTFIETTLRPSFERLFSMLNSPQKEAFVENYLNNAWTVFSEIALNVKKDPDRILAFPNTVTRYLNKMMLITHPEREESLVRASREIEARRITADTKDVSNVIIPLLERDFETPKSTLSSTEKEEWETFKRALNRFKTFRTKASFEALIAYQKRFSGWMGKELTRHMESLISKPEEALFKTGSSLAPEEKDALVLTARKQQFHLSLGTASALSFYGIQTREGGLALMKTKSPWKENLEEEAHIMLPSPSSFLQKDGSLDQVQFKAFLRGKELPKAFDDYLTVQEGWRFIGKRKTNWAETFIRYQLLVDEIKNQRDVYIENTTKIRGRALEMIERTHREKAVRHRLEKIYEMDIPELKALPKLSDFETGTE